MILNMDITTVEAPAIIMHGVNCQNKMGNGVAKALFTKWPKVKSRYHAFPNKRLGMTQPIQVEPKLWVINCFTQEMYGYDGKVYASPSAIEACILAVQTFAKMKGIEKIYSPKIGCGLGGLSWNATVSRLFRNTNIIICEV